MDADVKATIKWSADYGGTTHFFMPAPNILRLYKDTGDHGWAVATWVKDRTGEWGTSGGLGNVGQLPKGAQPNPTD